jgi:hypothetical protein
MAVPAWQKTYEEVKWAFEVSRRCLLSSHQSSRAG